MIEGTSTELACQRKDTKGESTGSSDLGSCDSSNSEDAGKKAIGQVGEEKKDTEVKDDEEVNQVKDLAQLQP